MRTTVAILMVWLAAALSVAAVLDVGVAGRLGDAEQFADAGVRAARGPQISEIVERRTRERLIDALPIRDERIERPVREAVPKALADPRYDAVLRSALLDWHEQVNDKSRKTTALRLDGASELILDELRRANPRLGAFIPASFKPPRFEVAADSPAGRLVRAATTARSFATPLAISAAAVLLLALLAARRRSTLLALYGGIVALLAIVLRLAVAAFHDTVLDRSGAAASLSSDDTRTAVTTLWDEYLGGIGIWLVGACLAGVALLVVFGAVAIATRPRAARAAGRYSEHQRPATATGTTEAPPSGRAS